MHRRQGGQAEAAAFSAIALDDVIPALDQQNSPAFFPAESFAAQMGKGSGSGRPVPQTPV
jgi:hypothetical protein